MKQNAAICIYPSRSRLVRVLLVQSCFVVSAIAIVLFALFRDLNPNLGDWVVGGLLGGCGALILLGQLAGELYRIIRRVPALIVDDEGVIDNSSCIVCGVGRIRWEDMYALVPREDYNEYRGGPRLFGPYLAIQLRYRDAFVGGLPRTIRLLRWMRRLMDWNRSDISIPQFMLDDAVPGIMSDIRGRYERLRHERHTSARNYPEVRMPY